jgi:chorismate mutase-like protein
LRTLAFVLVALVGVASRGADDPLATLRTTIAARLAVIEEVARYKWNMRLPAHDPAREAALLEKTVTDATALGLDPGYAREVVEAALDASRSQQIRAFERWRYESRPPFEHVRDLDRELRPELDALTHRLLVEVHDSRDLFGTCAARAALELPPRVDPAIWAIAIEPFVPTAECAISSTRDTGPR